MADLETATPPAPAHSVADPAPLGLAGFALTTFLLSAFNAGWTDGGGGGWIGYALAYGGIAQLLAGMWEYKRNNTFGATAFGSYGAFWIGLWFWVTHVAAGTGENVNDDLGWILLAFFIFNTYMLISSLKVNMAVFLVFLALEITELLLFIGAFRNVAPGTGLARIGGIVGVVTAALAWYASFAGVFNGLANRIKLPVGKPLNF